MKMYLPFGDGHKQWDKVLIEAPSMEHLLNAQNKLKKKYGNNFFDYYANEYQDPYLGEIVWQALIDTKYIADSFNDWSDVNSLEEALTIDKRPLINLSVIIDTYVWLLNAYGAEINILDEKEGIPTISNWT